MKYAWAAVVVGFVVLGCSDPQPPVVSDFEITTMEETVVSAVVEATDPQGDPLMFSISAPAHGTATIDGDVLTYTPAENYVGADSAIVTVTGGGRETTAAVEITVTAVPDAPVGGADSFAADEDVALVIPQAALLANDVDADGDTLSVVQVDGATHGTVSATGSNVTFTPASNYAGPASFLYMVSDGTSTVSVDVTVTVGGVNDAPDATNDNATTLEDTPIEISVATLVANDTDLEGQTLMVTAASTATNGNVALAGGIVTFTPTANFAGSATFEYTVSDGAATDTGTVSIGVTAANDGPIAVDDEATTPESTPITFTFAMLTGNDVDVDSAGKTVTAVANPVGCTVDIVGSTVVFKPLRLGFVGTASFDYTVSDGTLFDDGTVTVTVTEVAGDCGDAAGPAGADIDCSCGDRVITNTTLDSGLDPIIGGNPCTNGLSLFAGVQLDLGGLGLDGDATGTGITINDTGSVQNGTIQGFATGILISSTVAATVAIAGVELTGNGDGAKIAVTSANGRVTFDQVTASQNSAVGIRVVAAPGLANLDDVLARLPAANYGFVLKSSVISGNTVGGIVLGAADQLADVSAMIDSNDLVNNGGAGIVVQQKVASGADCGASAGQPGCTGATLVSNLIHNNAGPGATLRSGFIMPLYVTGTIDYGLGFLANSIAHNAMAGAGCNVAQAAPQISVEGVVGLSNTTCGATATEIDCIAANSPTTQHCVWTTTSTCKVSWDLRGDVADGCSNGVRNSISGYNVTDGGSAISVGLRAENSALVDASHNQWQTATSSQNVSIGSGSQVLAELTCGTTSCGF